MAGAENGHVQVIVRKYRVGPDRCGDLLGLALLNLGSGSLQGVVMRQRQLNGLLEVNLHRSSLGWRVDRCREEQQEELNADPKKSGGT